MARATADLLLHIDLVHKLPELVRSEDNKEVGSSIAALKKHGAARKPLHHAEGNHSVDLIWCQPRERLCFPSIRVGRIQRLARLESPARPDCVSMVIFSIVIADPVRDERS